jgi:hypothetical protein
VAANVAQQVTWCRIQKLRTLSGEGQDHAGLTFALRCLLADG